RAGNPGVHEPRADPGEAPRRPERHLRPRRAGLRDVHRAAPVPRQDRPGSHARAAQERAAPAAPGPARPPGQAGGGHRPHAATAPRGPLRLDERARGGPPVGGDHRDVLAALRPVSRIRRRFALLASAAGLGLGPAAARLPAQAQPPVEFLRSALARHRIVFLGDVHPLAEPKRILVRLLEDQETGAAIDLLALEVGSDQQETIDRYLASTPEDTTLLLEHPRTLRAHWGASEEDLAIYRAVYRW